MSMGPSCCSACGNKAHDPLPCLIPAAQLLKRFNGDFHQITVDCLAGVLTLYPWAEVSPLAQNSLRLQAEEVLKAVAEGEVPGLTLIDFMPPESPEAPR